MYADVWSLGVILYMLIVGRSPFSYGNPSETLTNIMDGKYEIPTHVSDQCRDLISRMLVVDTNSRPVLDEIKAHPWLQGCHDVEPTSPLLSTLGEVPEEDSEYILQRMELGNFGSKEDIVKTLSESPYSSISATYFLLAEAELQRKLHKMVQPKHPVQETLRRKLSVPDNKFLMGLSPRGGNGLVETPERSPYSTVVGSAEKGVLKPRRPTYHQTGLQERTQPLSAPAFTSPQLGTFTDGKKWNCPSSIFPVAVAGDEPHVISAEPDALYPKVLLQRKLSTFEEEDEEFTSPFSSRDNSRSASPAVKQSPLVNSSHSPMTSPRPSRHNFKPSPKLITQHNSISKSDGSDDPPSDSDEDEVVELLTASGTRRNSVVMRLMERSPAHSPAVPRRSPSHSWSVMSDDEGRRKSWRSNTSSFRSKLRNLRRVESSNSDDYSYLDALRPSPKTSLAKCSRQRARSMDIEERYDADLKTLTAKLKGRMSRESSNGSSDIGSEQSTDLHSLRVSVATKFDFSDEEDGSGGEMEVEKSKQHRSGVVSLNGYLPTSLSYSGLTERQRRKAADTLSVRSDIVTKSAYCVIL
jgi:hypothetical protein